MANNFENNTATTTPVTISTKTFWRLIFNTVQSVFYLFVIGGSLILVVLICLWYVSHMDVLYIKTSAAGLNPFVVGQFPWGIILSILGLSFTIFVAYRKGTLFINSSAPGFKESLVGLLVLGLFVRLFFLQKEFYTTVNSAWISNEDVLYNIPGIGVLCRKFSNTEFKEVIIKLVKEKFTSWDNCKIESLVSEIFEKFISQSEHTMLACKTITTSWLEHMSLSIVRIETKEALSGVWWFVNNYITPTGTRVLIYSALIGGGLVFANYCTNGYLWRILKWAVSSGTHTAGGGNNNNGAAPTHFGGGGFPPAGPDFSNPQLGNALLRSVVNLQQGVITLDTKVAALTATAAVGRSAIGTLTDVAEQHELELSHLRPLLPQMEEALIQQQAHLNSLSNQVVSQGEGSAANFRYLVTLIAQLYSQFPELEIAQLDSFGEEGEPENPEPPTPVFQPFNGEGSALGGTSRTTRLLRDDLLGPAIKDNDKEKGSTDI